MVKDTYGYISPSAPAAAPSLSSKYLSDPVLAQFEGQNKAVRHNSYMLHAPTPLILHQDAGFQFTTQT